MDFRPSKRTIRLLGKSNEISAGAAYRQRGGLTMLKSVSAMPEYRLHLCYENGEERIYDAAWATKHLSDFFDQHIDPQYFAKVASDGFGVEWPNGQSISPEELEEHGKLIVHASSAVAGPSKIRYTA